MDDMTKGFSKAQYNVAIHGLVNVSNHYIYHIRKIEEDINSLHKIAMEDLPIKNLLLNSYESQIKEQDAEIKRLNEKLSKKSLLHRIFG
jgi:hypothetical protein